MDLIAAILIAGIASTLLFAGYRLARIAIPLWGFLIGLSLGGAVMSELNDTPFLGTVIGVFVGLIAGLFFGAVAYIYYWAAVILMAAGLGYWMGSSFMLLIGLSPGFLSISAGIAVGAALGMFALMGSLPKYVLIVLTSIGGAVALVGALLVLFNQIPLEAFSYAAARSEVGGSWWWGFVAALLATTGVIVQSVNSRHHTFVGWLAGEDSEEEKWSQPPVSS
jgi:hypothetical protein